VYIKNNKLVDDLINVKVKISATDINGNLWLATFVLEKSKYMNHIIPYFKNIVTKELNYFQNPKLESYQLNNKKLKTINMLASGLKNEDIAKKLNIKIPCLQKRINELLIDFNVNNRSELLKIILNLVKL